MAHAVPPVKSTLPPIASERVAQHLNEAAAINPVNLVGPGTLSTNRLALNDHAPESAGYSTCTWPCCVALTPRHLDVA
jgi:hypothetical protein